jgi:hypothetical protein
MRAEARKNQDLSALITVSTAEICALTRASTQFGNAITP